ncbi:hypothetical protein [Streptomyces flaveolus]
MATGGDCNNCVTAAHLDSYAGIAPVTRHSRTSPHGEHSPVGTTAS